MVFFDDILISTQSWEEHTTNLRQVMETLAAEVLANRKKKKQVVRYLGHVISQKGVQMDPKIIEAIHQWPTPKTAKV